MQTSGYGNGNNGNNNDGGYRQQRGYTEPAEAMEKPRGFRSAGGMGEMLEMLLQQVLGMSAMVEGQSGRTKSAKLSRVFKD